MPDGSNRRHRVVPPEEREETGSIVVFPHDRSLPRPPHNLPMELSSFVGREEEIAELKGLLGDGARLVTLCGSGGCGKTRLALAVAQEMVEGFKDGVWWVELAPLSDPKLVPGAMALALGVREVPDRSLTEVIVEHLKPKKALLILDNCEHLVDGCADLADALLRACPDLRILATSREPLRIAGEAAWLVPSLSLPDPQHLPPAAELTRYEAVRLFLERTKAVDASFALTERGAAAVARLCQRLDGIPLAIELAAARTRALTVEQIAEKLEDPLGLLTTGSRVAAPRHQTLRAALQWSYELLDEAERRLFERLSVFAGGWDLEAAEAVGSAGTVRAAQVLDLLSNLVDKSLVVAEKGVGGDASILRYRMLEPVRQFAREKLQASPEAPEVLRRHAGHYLALAETAEPELMGARQGEWFGRLRIELGNLMASLSWSLESVEDSRERAGLGLRLAAALRRFWDIEGFGEAKRWIRAALEKDPGGFPADRAKALGALGWILLFQREYGPAIAALEEAVALHKELGDESGAAFALANLGFAVVHGGLGERVSAFVQDGEALMRVDLEGHARTFLGIALSLAAIAEGDYNSAASQVEESLALSRELGDTRNTGYSFYMLGMAELLRGNLDRGETLLEDCILLARELEYSLGSAYTLFGLGKVAALRGKPGRAARMWGAAEALREQLSISLSQFDLVHCGYERDLAAVISALSDASFEAAWAEGRAMSPEQAIDYALQPAPDEPAPPREAAAEESHPSTTSPDAALHIFALGRARVERDGHPLSPSPDWIHKPRELLFYLLSHPEGRTKEQIGLALWPDASTSQLRSSFHDTVFRLRRALGAKEWVSFAAGRYAFGGPLPRSFDVEEFRRSVSEAEELRSSSPDDAIGRLQTATGLYGGDFLEDSAFGEWAMEVQDELRREHQDALMLLGRLLYAEGRFSEAASAYRGALGHDEFSEEAHRGLMRSHAALGERGRALRHYDELEGLLEEQLGTSPAPETMALYKRLRAGREVS